MSYHLTETQPIPEVPTSPLFTSPMEQGVAFEIRPLRYGDLPVILELYRHIHAHDGVPDQDMAARTFGAFWDRRAWKSSWPGKAVLPVLPVILT